MMRLKELVCDALEFPPARRGAFLDDACHCAEERRLVDEMLAQEERLGSFLEPPIWSSSFMASTHEVRIDLDSLEGTLIGDRFRLCERLGAGATGVVHAAVDSHTEREVAVKLLVRFPASGARWLRNEIASLRLLWLPGVVHLIDEGVHAGAPYLVTERVRGQPFPGRRTPTPWDGIVESTIGLIECVGRIHAAGVVHGDLKPANVLVREDGRVVVLDLGVSSGPALRAASGEARHSGLFGTLPYMAPDLIAEKPPTPATDFFAVGVMLFEALTGTVPHASSGPAEFLDRRQNEPITLPDSIPTEAAGLLDALLHGEPDSRARAVRRTIGSMRGHPTFAEWTRTHVRSAEETELQELFDGPDRILHLREDAAHELARRAGGNVERASEVLGAWLRAGLARIVDARVRVTRETLDALSAGDEEHRGGVAAALAAVRAEWGSAAREQDALRVLLRTALSEGTTRCLDVFLYELGRSSLADARAGPLRDLGRAALLTVHRDGQRAFARTGAVGELTNQADESIRISVRELAARSTSLALHTRFLGEAHAWARTTSDAEAPRLLASWTGWNHYLRGDFHAAASAHEEAAAHATKARDRVSARLNAASAWLECFELERARDDAQASLSDLGSRRHPHHEARAERILRAVAYRSRAASEPDLELAHAIAYLPVPNLEGAIVLNEAAVAWRSGQDDVARELARRAESCWETSGRHGLRALAIALRWAAGDPVGETDPREVARIAVQAHLPGITIQTLGLLARSHPGAVRAHREAVRSFHHSIDPRSRALRREVASADEAMQWVREGVVCHEWESPPDRPA